MIKNAKDITLNDSTNNLPNLGNVLDGWLVKLTFIKITTEIINFKAVETSEEFSFGGVWQPLNNSELKLKQEHERAWKWYNCHSKTNLNLKNNDIITYKGSKFRVMTTGFYEDYGYYNYHLVEDYE